MAENINKPTDESQRDRLRRLIVKSGTAQMTLRELKDQLIWTGNNPNHSEEEKERKKASLKIEIEKQQKIVDKLETEIAELKKK